MSKKIIGVPTEMDTALVDQFQRPLSASSGSAFPEQSVRTKYLDSGRPDGDEESAKAFRKLLPDLPGYVITLEERGAIRVMDAITGDGFILTVNKAVKGKSVRELEKERKQKHIDAAREKRRKARQLEVRPELQVATSKARKLVEETPSPVAPKTPQKSEKNEGSITQ